MSKRGVQRPHREDRGARARRGVMLLASHCAIAADKLGVSMPNIKGPWFTPILFGITDEAKKLGYEIIILDAGGYAQRRQAGEPVLEPDRAEGQRHPAWIRPIRIPSTASCGRRRPQRSRWSAPAARSSPAASKPTPRHRRATAASDTSSPRAPRPCCRTAAPIAILAGPPGAFWASDRLRCFKEDLAGGNIKIVAEQTSEQDAAIALSLANDFLQRFPTVDMLYGADDTYGVGAARAAQGAQKCGKVKVLFAVLGEAAEEMMRAGCADYVVAQQPVLIGRTAAEMVDKIMKGQPLPKKLDEIPLIPVTKANLDSINKTTMQAPKGWTP